MKPRHWFFLVGLLLHVTGLGFVIGSARTARDAPPPPPAVTLTPIASVKQIMKGIVTPAANTVFQSVSTTVSARGIEEKQPRDDEEWEMVGNGAAALIESGNLLMMGSRAIDKDDWIKMAQALIDASQIALKATQEKNAEKLLESGEGINTSCDNCHKKYQRG
jgi:hypothetical protein